MNWRKYAPIVLRLGLSGVFLWFGLNQAFDAGSWFGYVPGWATGLGLSMTRLVVGNGAFEIAMGLLLASGTYVRPVALLLALHLLVIAIGLGYNDIMIRDLGLAIACVSVAMHGPDDWSWMR